ncbi:uncharacterized protein LOC121720857 isoform X1 [Alosa sapidissima]|uniref:uncharacterized protein LOC121720857 isoform X1 n=1 Tax=Alosa sapidissima TaxID=34773 RepID=UPI001C09CADB|nr:uncharacterized protein LOC121720857 isoform X1 [Alosa sapidissima]XP_041963268.1 uncharacterized protein LOC121720857 isoform X1 [Alosa sapidissima]XP_041963270.1 uncharacterized protein LOC121720857 isoform X1 [Alosa sapidissima]
MISRKLLLLVSLFLWEEFGRAGSAVKVVRRRGLSGQRSLKPEGKVLADQWEESPEKVGLATRNLKDLLARDQAERSDLSVIKKLSQNHATHPLLTKREDGQSFGVKLDGLDSAVHGLSGSNEAALEPRKSRNGTRGADSSLPKPGRTDKGLPIHHKIDFGLHPNRTRTKSLARSGARAGSAVHPGQTPKGLSLESPRKLNLTGSYGVLKLISKENLVRIVNSQLQSMVGLNFQGKASRSRKRDLIDVDHSLPTASKVKRQDRAVASDLYGIPDNQTEELHMSATSHVNLNTEQAAHSLWKPVSEFSSSDSVIGRPSERASPKGQLVTETWSSSSSGVVGGKRLSAHLASTPQAEVLNTERDASFGYSDTQAMLRSGTSNSPQRSDGASPSVYTLDPWGVRSVSGGGKRERGGAPVEDEVDEEREVKEYANKNEALEESIQPPELESSVTQDPVWAVAERPNSSHVLKLRPETEWAAGKTGTGGGGRMGHGLMFEEAEKVDEDNNDDDDDDDAGNEGRGHNEGGGKRSRSRRSWIWNQFFVIEEYTGPEPVLIGRLHTDMDRADGRTRYKLRGDGAGSVFVIDEKTGNIHVTKPLDREEKDEYRLIATATDRQTDRALEPSSTFIIRVQDINDNPPIFEEAPYSATVPEMANIGTSIIQVTATDADDPTYGNSARLVYTLVQGQQYFSVDPQTGILRTAVPDMDRETQDQYLVVLQAKDMGGHLGGLSGTTTVTVHLSDVNDNPPRFSQSMWSFSVSELAVPGAEVGRISATDADLGENAKLEYTILEGETGDIFNITGINQEAIIVLNKPVDYESRSSYSFSVEVLNPMVDPRFLRRGPFKDRASIRVSVLDADEPPRFSRTRYRLDVSENCPPACTVGRVSAVDPDTGLNTNIRFSIDPQSDPEALFHITPDTGLITTAAELDREREQWHNITVIAMQRDSPSQVSRVVVAIETLDLNDNAPELDRQYTTAVCDSTAAGQVVQVLRAIDRDEGGNDSTVHFNIPAESGTALNFTIRESGGPTASLVLVSPLQTLSRSPSSSLTLHVPLILRDGASGMTSTGTVTVTVCPCLRGGARASEKERQQEAEGSEWEREAVCLPQPSSSPSPGLSTAALLAILACVATLLAVSALSLSLRRQKRDSLSPLEEDDVRENIITYDDEGGGEADTAAFDIAALQSAPHSVRRGYRTLDSRNIRYSQHVQDKSRTYSWAQAGAGGGAGALEPAYSASVAPLYGRLCYSSQTLPVLRRGQGPLEPGAAELGGYRIPGGPPDHSLVIQNQGAMVGTLEHCAMYGEPGGGGGGSPREGTTSQDGATASEGGTPRTNDSKERLGGGTGTDSSSDAQQSQDLDWVQPEPGAREQQTLVLTRSGSLAGTATGIAAGGWLCDSATLPLAGRRASRADFSPKRGSIATAGGPSEPVLDGGGGVKETQTQSLSRNYATVVPVDGPRDYMGSLGRGGGLEMGSSFVVARPEREGGIPLSGPPCGGLYPDGGAFMADWRERVGLGGGGGYVLARRDMTPQLLPFPGQGRGRAAAAAFGAVLGYGGGGGWGSGPEAGRAVAGGAGGGQSLALRVGEFLRLRLAQVTFDPSQPPYDSVQVYGLEGTGSRAGSLSSLESEGDKEADKEEWGKGMEEWGPQFHKLALLFREREKERGDKKGNEEETEPKEGNQDGEKETRASEEAKD